MNKIISKSLIATSILSLILGCAQSPGLEASDEAPRLVKNGDALTWNKVSVFGTVPSDLLERGNAACAALNNAETKFAAKGYHPKALDLQGQPFTRGGFYCSAQKR